MTIQTDLSVWPYFDDFNPEKDFYRILFRPGVSVQARELNQVQSIFQNQIERFGNNIFRQGTIIDGCDITFHDSLKYVKLRDTETNSRPVDVESYRSYRVKNQNDIVPLEAVIIDVDPGFESTNPDLNTLYLRYINTGFEQGGPAEGQETFEPGELLTIYDPTAPIESVTINNGSSGFAPTDRVVFVSAIAVQNTTGGTEFTNGFGVGDDITDGTATVRILEIDSDSIADHIVFRVAPLVQDLVEGDFSRWTLTRDTNVQRLSEGNESSIAVIKQIVGSGAQASLNTSALGEVTSIEVTSKGSGYIIPPFVTISSLGAGIGQTSLFNATARNILANVTVAGAEFDPVGNSYGMTVGEGVIYQKGFFSRVSEQLLIIEKYNNQPDSKSVGFETDESIVDASEDRSLLDNATGAPNFAAPGANRLRLAPRLKVITRAEAEQLDDWLYIVEFANGEPFKQNRQTVYNVIGKEIDRRFGETAGNFVTNPFLLTTKNANLFADESNSFNIVVDPGTAFINGARVETTMNFERPVDKGITTREVTNANVSINYGNFVRVNNVGGHFQFKQGDVVELYDAPGEYYNGVVGSQPSPSGVLIGRARIRSMVFDSGIAGTPGGVFKLYLFDVRMNLGQNFSRVRSIYHGGAVKGIADPVLENGQAVIRDNANTTLLYFAGSRAVNNASNISYIFRTSNATTIGNSGSFTISVQSASTQRFPYTGVLSARQRRDLIVVPTQSAISSTTTAGTASVSQGSDNVTGVGTAFVAEYAVGDFIRFETTGTALQIAEIINNTTIRTTQPSPANVSGSAHRLFFPAFAPIDLERAGRSVTTSGDQTQLTINIGTGLVTPSNATVTYNVREAEVAPVAKTVNRNRFVRLRLQDAVAGEAGPWPLGVGDVFRLRKVYRGTNSSFGPSDGVDVTSSFFIDHNQNEDFYGISYLYLRQRANITLTPDDYLLVEFDHFTVTPGAEGLKGPGGSGTYPIDDTLPLQSAVSTINTVEIPETFGQRGTYYDLRDHFDFRPSANNSVTPSTDFTAAPINPIDQPAASTLTNADKKFPAPDSEITATISYYEGRTDRVIIDDSNRFRVLAGTPGSIEPPRAPDGTLSINILNIPPYPSLPFLLSQEMIDYVDTNISNERFTTRRVNEYRVTTAVTDRERSNLQPRGFTMSDIGRLERRISNLEYYTSLTLTELIAQKRTMIGFDGIDRFKFGFFVDGFEDYTFADTTNPEYSAQIIDGYLSPRTNEIGLQMISMDQTGGLMPFVEQSFISQTKATEPPEAPIETPARTQVITSVIQSQRSFAASDNQRVFEDFFYTFSETAGPVEFYINSRGNRIAAEISQSTTPNGPWTPILTSRSGQGITAQDVLTKRLQGLNENRRFEGLGTFRVTSGPNSPIFGNWIGDQFKLLWNHNPANGIFIRVRIYKGGRRGGIFRKGRGGAFGFKLFYPTDTDVNQTRVLPTTNFDLRFGGIGFGGGGGANLDPFLFNFNIV